MDISWVPNVDSVHKTLAKIKSGPQTFGYRFDTRVERALRAHIALVGPCEALGPSGALPWALVELYGGPGP